MNRGGGVICAKCVGVQDNIKFWEDKWVGDTPLCYRFPRLYGISNCKHKTIGELGE